MTKDIRNVVIIGSGPAGYTAGIYSARASLAPLLIAGGQPGGQLMLTTEVENWPGEDEGILGADLMANMRAQAARFGTEFMDDIVQSVDSSVYPFVLHTASGKEIAARTVIVATGASAKWLGIPGEDGLKGRGVSACATCDAFFFKDKKVMIVGGGDSAMEEALFIAKFASEVVVLVRSDKLRASKIMQDRVKEHAKITLRWNAVAVELVGKDKLESVKVQDTVTGEEEIVSMDGFFVAIGHTPNVGMVTPAVQLDERGYIKHAPDSTKTNVEGIFACGDVIDPWYRQAITAAGTGCMAALEAERWLAAQGHE